MRPDSDQSITVRYRTDSGPCFVEIPHQSGSVPGNHVHAGITLNEAFPGLFPGWAEHGDAVGDDVSDKAALAPSAPIFPFPRGFDGHPLGSRCIEYSTERYTPTLSHVEWCGGGLAVTLRSTFSPNLSSSFSNCSMNASSIPNPHRNCCHSSLCQACLMIYRRPFTS